MTLYFFIREMRARWERAKISRICFYVASLLAIIASAVAPFYIPDYSPRSLPQAPFDPSRLGMWREIPAQANAPAQKSYSVHVTNYDMGIALKSVVGAPEQCRAILDNAIADFMAGTGTRSVDCYEDHTLTTRWAVQPGSNMGVVWNRDLGAKRIWRTRPDFQTRRTDA